MSEIGAFELVIEFLREHQERADPSAGTKVVLVLDDELAQNHEIYSAALRRIGGVYISVDRMVGPRVKGTIEPSLAKRLADFLLLSGLRLEIDIQQAGAEVSVLKAGGIDPVNESERLVLSFLASLFSEEFASHPVAAISWSEMRLELLAKDVLWQLVRTHVNKRPLGALRTLIFIGGGRVDPDLHCEHETSITFALSKTGLFRRKSRASLDAAVAKLVRASQGKFVLFLGAGASASAGMPLGNEARDYALEHFFRSSAARPVTELAPLFHQWVRENNRLLASEDRMPITEFTERLTLERVLREEFRRDGRYESPTLRHLQDKNKNAIELKKTRVRMALRRLAGKAHKLVIVTVNFDTILEDEFRDGVKIFASPKEFESASAYLQAYFRKDGPIPVLKLHGTLTKPDSIVADVDTRSLGLAPAIAEALQQLLGTNDARTPWVYVGTSMRDPDVTEVLGASVFTSRLDEWWVSPLPDPAVRLFVNEHRAPRWRKGDRADLQERQITETADTFLTVLSEEWRGAP